MDRPLDEGLMENMNGYIGMESSFDPVYKFDEK